MKTLTGTSTRAAQAAELQTIFRTHPRLRLELMACVSRLFREHEIDVSPEVLASITLTIEGTQVSSELAGGPPPDPPQHHRDNEEAYRIQY